MSDKLHIRINEKETPTTSVDKNASEIHEIIRGELEGLKAEARESKLQKIKEILEGFFVAKEERTESDTQYAMYFAFAGVTYRIEQPFDAADFTDGDPEVDVETFMQSMMDYAFEIANLDTVQEVVVLEMTHPFQEGIQQLQDEVENNKLFGEYQTVLNDVRGKANSWNVMTLKDLAGRLDEMHEKLIAAYSLTWRPISSASSPQAVKLGSYETGLSLSPVDENALLTLANNYHLMKDELDLRIALEEKQSHYKSLLNQVEVEQAKGDKAKEKTLKDYADQMLVTGHEIDEIVWNLKGFPHIDPGTIHIRSTPRLRPDRVKQLQEKGFDAISVPVNGVVTSVSSVDNLMRTYAEQIPGKRQEEIIAMVADIQTHGRGSLAGLTMPELEFAIAYQQLSFNHMLGLEHTSEAAFLEEFVKIDSNLNDKEFGTISDFRKLGKRIKKEAKEENKKSKYLLKAFPHLVAYARARAINAQGLNMYDMLLNQRSGLAHAHQPNLGVDIWNSPPYYLSEVAQDWFGGEWQSLIGDMKLPGYAVGDKHFSRFMPPHLLISNSAPGTHLDRPGETLPNAMVVRHPEGGWEVMGDLSDDALLGLYLQTYNIHVINPPEAVDKKFTNTQLAHNLLQRWFRGGEYAFDIVTSMQQKGLAREKAMDIAEKILLDGLNYDDDLILSMRDAYHDQASYYRAAKEKVTGHEIVTRDITRIPVSERHRMFSRAAVEGMAKKLGLKKGDYPMIQDRLQTLYGGSRNNMGGLVDNSNEKVGSNMARLVDSLTSAEYAISPRNFLRDFGSVDNIVDQVQTHGIPGAMGNALTAGLQELPWMKSENAERIGKIVGTVGKIAAVVWIAKSLFTWIGKGNGGRGKIWRVGAVGAGALLFGRDIGALVFGGKGGMLADAAEHYMDNADDFNDNKISSQQMLAFTFGNVTLAQLHEQVVFNSKTGQFELKPEVSAELTALGLEKEQEEILQSLLGEGRTGMNQMIHEGLRDSGISDGAVFDSVARKHGHMKVKDWINTMVTVEVIRHALGPTVDDATVKAIEVKYLTLSQTEQRLMKTRIDEVGRFGKQFTHTKLYLHDHLALHRPDLLSDNGIQRADIIAGYADTAGLAAAQKSFILGDIDQQTMNANIDALFGTASAPFGRPMHALRYEDMRTAIEAATPPPANKEKLVVDITDPTAHTAGGMMLGGASGASPGPDEMMVHFGTADPRPYIFGVETSTATVPGGTVPKKYLTFWIENGSGAWEEFKIETINGADALIEGFAYDTFGGTSSKFGLMQWKSSPTSGAPGYRLDDAFGVSMLQGIVASAEQGKSTYAITNADITNTSASAMAGTKVTFVKTGNRREPY